MKGLRVFGCLGFKGILGFRVQGFGEGSYQEFFRAAPAGFCGGGMVVSF